MFDKFTIYFYRKILKLLFVYTIIFIFVFILIDFVIQLKAPSAIGTTKIELLTLSFFKTSEFLIFLLPVICSLPLIQLFYKLAKRGQLETLQSFGVSPFRFGVKVAMIYVAITYLLIITISYIDPIFEKKVHELEIKVFGSRFNSHSNLTKFWLELLGDQQTKIISFKHFNSDTKELYDVKLISFDDEFGFSKLITAKMLKYIDRGDSNKKEGDEAKNTWFAMPHSYKVINHDDFLYDKNKSIDNQITPKTPNTNPLFIELNLTFEQVSSQLVFANQLNLYELFSRIINQDKYLKNKVLTYKIRLAKILSIPLFMFGIVLFIIYFFLRFSRELTASKFFIGITFCIIIGQLFFLISNILSAYMISFNLNIFYGVFLLPIIFGLFGLMIILSLEIDLITTSLKYLKSGFFQNIKKRFLLLLISIILLTLTNIFVSSSVLAQIKATKVIKSKSLNDILINKLSIDSNSRFDLFADKFDISTETQLITAKGNIVSKIGGIGIESESADYDKKRDVITYRDNIIITIESAVSESIEILAEELSFDRKTNLISAKGVLFSKDRLRIQAESLATDEQERLVLYDSLATFCDYCADSALKWRVSSKRTVFDDLDERIKFYDGVYVKINYTPVFFSKYFSIPYPNITRASGLLVPGLGYTSSELLFLYQPYFHVIDDKSDFTITPLLTMSSYLSTLLEYRNFAKKYEFKITNYIGLSYKSEKSNTDQAVKPRFATMFKYHYSFNDNWSSRVDLSVTNNRNPITELEIFDINSNIYKNQVSFNGIYNNQMLRAELVSKQDLSLKDHSIEHAQLPRISYNAWMQFDNNAGYIDYNFDFSYLTIGLNNYQEVYDNNIAVYNSFSYNLPYNHKGFKSKNSLYLKSAIFFSNYAQEHRNYIKSSYEVGMGQELSYAFILPTSSYANILEPKMKLEASYSNGGTIDYAELIHESWQTDKNNIFSNSYYLSNGVLNRGVRLKYGFDYSLVGLNTLDKFNFFIGHSWSFYNQRTKISNNAFVLEADYYGKTVGFSMKTNISLNKKNPLLYFHTDLSINNFLLGYRREYFPDTKDYLNQMVIGYYHKFDRLLFGIENVISLDKVKLLDIELKLGYQNECLEFSINFGKDFKVEDLSKGYKILTNFQLIF